MKWLLCLFTSTVICNVVDFLCCQQSLQLYSATELKKLAQKSKRVGSDSTEKTQSDKRRDVKTNQHHKLSCQMLCKFTIYSVWWILSLIGVLRNVISTYSYLYLLTSLWSDAVICIVVDFSVADWVFYCAQRLHWKIRLKNRNAVAVSRQKELILASGETPKRNARMEF